MDINGRKSPSDKHKQYHPEHQTSNEYMLYNDTRAISPACPNGGCARLRLVGENTITVRQHKHQEKETNKGDYVLARGAVSRKVLPLANIGAFLNDRWCTRGVAYILWAVRCSLTR